MNVMLAEKAEADIVSYSTTIDVRARAGEMVRAEWRRAQMVEVGLHASVACYGAPYRRLG